MCDHSCLTLFLNGVILKFGSCDQILNILLGEFNFLKYFGSHAYGRINNDAFYNNVSSRFF